MPALTFPEHYFEGEERCGFYVEPLMKRAWAAQLEVLEQIRKICDRHGILFYADYGTLLGAVRHQGFIPWDDDLDLTMFRNDLMRFIRYAKAELPEGYEILGPQDTPDYDNLVIVRVVNTARIRIDQEFLDEYHGCPYCVGIDIFPLDYIPEDPEERRFQKNLLEITTAALSCWKSKENGLADKRLLINKVEDLLNVQIDEAGDVTMQLNKLLDALSAMYGSGESDTVGIAFRMTYLSDEVVLHPMSYYADVINQPFEGVTTVPVPIGYDELLRQNYGEYTQYAVYPAHDYPLYRNQVKQLKEALAAAGQTLADYGIPDIEREDPLSNPFGKDEA